MRIEVLGPVRVVHDDGTTVEISRPARRRLLSILALANGKRVSTDVLIDRFWPQDPPDTARAAIQTHVAGLRSMLGSDVIATEGYGYRLNLIEHTLDVAELGALASDADKGCRHRDWEDALAAIEAALALWQGEPFVELTYDDFARPEISRLEELRLVLLERRAEALVALGRSEDAVPDLEALVIAHPFRERLWEHLMRARYQLGRHTEALRAYQEAVAHLAGVGLEPGARLRRLEEKMLFHHASLVQTPHDIPTELDTFVGRDEELNEARKLLGEERLVTFTGPGGSGKTRLAVRLARDALDDFPDGVWFVPLAPLREGGLIASEIGRVIGLRLSGDDALGDVTAALAVDRTLVVLDNCEHLGDSVAGVAQRLLEGCPELRILATSRSALRVPGEIAYSVSGLSVPSDATAMADAMDHDSIRLFVDRAGRASGTSDLTVDDVTKVTEVCRRLDGLPLAIELAAARTAALSVETLAARLDEHFRLLGEGPATAPLRHRTLEAAIGWSYDLLSLEEQIVFERLGVFRGGFDLDMAELVAGAGQVPPVDVVAKVASLVEKSLLVPYEWAGGRRYRLLETIRRFALDRLGRRGDVDDARGALVRWAVSFAASFWPGVYSGHASLEIARVHEDFDNLVAAAGWAGESDEHASSDVSLLHATLARHWLELRHLRRYEETVREAISRGRDPVWRAELDAHHSWVLWAVNRPDDAWVAAERSYQTLRAELPSPASVHAVQNFAMMHWLLTDRSSEDGIAIATEAVRLAVASGDVSSELRSRVSRAVLLVTAGEEDDGLAEVDRALEVLKRVEHPVQALRAYHSLITATMAVRRVRRTAPRGIVARMLEVADSAEHLAGIGASWVAYVYLQTGEWEEAARILESTTAMGHLEEMDKLSLLIPRATMHWMRGDLGAALLDIGAAEEVGVHPRWYHDFLALKSELGTDRGVLDEARQAAEFYLGFEVDSSEASKKLGTLHPLVRGEVEAALAASTDHQRRDHERRAREALDTMRQILREHPAPNTGSFMCETHDTHLSFAIAELSRLDDPDPDLWRVAYEAADYIYYRLYAQWRLGEALLAANRRREAERCIADAAGEADRVGARLLANRIRAAAGYDFGSGISQ